MARLFIAFLMTLFMTAGCAEIEEALKGEGGESESGSSPSTGSPPGTPAGAPSDASSDSPRLTSRDNATLANAIFNKMNNARVAYLSDPNALYTCEFANRIAQWIRWRAIRPVDPKSLTVVSLPRHAFASQHAQAAAAKNLENYLNEVTTHSDYHIPPDQDIGMVGHCHFVNHNGCNTYDPELQVDSDLKAQGYAFSLRENLYSTTETGITSSLIPDIADTVVNGFLNSYAHRKNALWPPRSAMGVGVAIGGPDRKGRTVITVSVEYVCDPLYCGLPMSGQYDTTCPGYPE